MVVAEYKENIPDYIYNRFLTIEISHIKRKVFLSEYTYYREWV